MGVFDHFPYTNFHELNLQWILQHFKEFIAELAELEDWRRQHENEYEELKKIVDDIEHGIFPDQVYQKLYKWLQANMFDIIGNMVKFITVTINDNGYIVIKYPSQWNELIFNTTGLDINVAIQPEYGHLTISFKEV